MLQMLYCFMKELVYNSAIIMYVYMGYSNAYQLFFVGHLCLIRLCANSSLAIIMNSPYTHHFYLCM